MNLFQNILNKVAPEPKSTFLSGFTPTPIFTGKTTSEKIASGEIKATKATPKEMQSAFGKEPAFWAWKGGIWGSILRNISKTPSTFDPNKQIIEPVLTPIETGINKTITWTTEFVGSGQKELASRKTVRQSETDRKIDETINELANEGYTEEQIMSVFEDLNTEWFFKDKPWVVEWMSQRFFGSLESGVNRATEAQASPYSLPEKSLATGIAIPSTIVSAPFNALFGGALEKGMENLPDEAKQKIAEAWQIYEQFAQQNPRTAFNIKTASDVATIAPLSPKVRWIVTKPIGKVVTKVDNSISDLRKSLSKNNAVKAQKLNDEWLKEIYEAVNPTTRENKAVLRQRVEDLLPYIDENKRFANDLETVKGRVDVDKNVAFKAMEDYETNVWVKWKVDTASVAKALENKYMEKIWDSFVNKTEAEIAKELIDTLKGFGKTVNDADIIKIRRAWDKIIEKNKGFMQSADATSKGDIFADANRFFREEIKKSNPEYAKYLEKAHKTITISDILDATIQRRTGQTQGGFLRQWLENAARIAWTGLGGTIGGMVWSPATGAMIWFGASELLMGGVKKLTGSSAKLTTGKKLILKNPKNVTNPINNSNTRVLPMESTEKQLTSWPRLKTPVTPKVVKPSPKPIVKNLQKTEKSATIGDMETKKLIEEARNTDANLVSKEKYDEVRKSLWDWFKSMADMLEKKKNAGLLDYIKDWKSYKFYDAKDGWKMLEWNWSKFREIKINPKLYIPILEKKLAQLKEWIKDIGAYNTKDDYLKTKAELDFYKKYP